MVTGATSLSLVRDELFATIEQAELSLEQFIGERSNGHLLQQAVEGLQQIRGTLKLIELTGAEMLAQEMLDQANDIPAGAGNERDDQLSALSSALYVLRRYLESVDANRQEIPELLLPTINELRRAGQTATQHWELKDVWQWYDFAVTCSQDAKFYRRFAGRVETGDDSVSDPAMV
jgi:hypothetical protein